jgi:hypothetical protein
VVGSWKVDHEFGRETIEFRADGTFVQTMSDSGGSSVTNEGHWEFRKGDVDGAVVHLESAICFADPSGHRSADRTPIKLDLLAVREWGRLTLSFNPDFEGFTRL